MSQETQPTQTPEDNGFATHPRTLLLLERARGGEDVTGSVPDAHRETFQRLLNPERELPAPSPEATHEMHPSDMNAAELEEFLNKEIPPQYRMLSAEALRVVWSSTDVHYYADDQSGERRQKEMKQRDLTLAALEDFLPEAQRRARLERTAALSRKSQIAAVKAKLKPESKETGEKKSGLLSSEMLDETKTHRFESQKKSISVLHSNIEHGQDAFAANAEKGVFCVSDGASSYGKSGVVSGEFSRALAADAASGKPFSEIFSEANMKVVAEKVKRSEAYKTFNTDENPHAKGANKEAGLATTLLTRVKEDGSIEWASIGDSPLMVLDENPDGTYSFEIVNDDVNGIKITDKNFTDEKIAAALGTPETHLVGIGKDGAPRLQDLKHMKQGSIEYKKGRVVILASDFLTKMMALSPQMVQTRLERAKAAGKESLAKAYQDIQDTTAGFNNPLAGKQFKPELLFNGQLSKEDLKAALDQWKQIPGNNAGRDDMTAVCIKMDSVKEDMASKA